MHKQPAEVFTVFFDPVVVLFDVLLLQKAQHLLLQLSAALAGNDFHQLYLLVNCLLNDVVQGIIDLSAFVVNVVEVNL